MRGPRVADLSFFRGLYARGVYHLSFRKGLVNKKGARGNAPLLSRNDAAGAVAQSARSSALLGRKVAQVGAELVDLRGCAFDGLVKALHERVGFLATEGFR